MIIILAFASFNRYSSALRSFIFWSYSSFAIYSTKSLYSKKHSLFHESLIKNQYAQLLGSNIVSGFSSKAIDDSEKIAKKIKEMIKI